MRFTAYNLWCMNFNESLVSESGSKQITDCRFNPVDSLIRRSSQV